MKKKLWSVFLAAALLSGTVTGCGNTPPKETEESGITAPVESSFTLETEEAETNTPVAPVLSDHLTENGTAVSQIVIAEGASQLERFAAEELVYHIKKVSGADVPVVNSIDNKGLSVIIGTPDSLPELEALFPEDLAWLRTTDEGNGRRWGDDGFAIRRIDNKIYVFGAVPKGAQNGVYDFIEENLGVLWIRADDEIGLIYDEMPTIEVTKADYREKSPFQFRGSSGGGAADPSVDTVRTRNKLTATTYGMPGNGMQEQVDVGLEIFVCLHNIKWWIIYSPLYDPNNSEYWETDENGVHGTMDSSIQANVWSDLTIDTIAAHMIAQLDEYHDSVGLRRLGVSLEDALNGRVYPEDTEPFEYAPGQFVYPEEADYYSTVYYTFLNKIAKQVGEKYPDVMINTYAYYQTMTPPKCELEDNIEIVFCFIHEDLTQPNIKDAAGMYPEMEAAAFKGWLEKTQNIICYSYYGCYLPSGWYERPTWDRIQNDFQYFAEHGLTGMQPDIYKDYPPMEYYLEKLWDFDRGDIWAMNILTHWLVFKLAWNPYEDVDALIVEFCDKVYGEASEHMQEYYRLLKMGWDDGCEYHASQFNANCRWDTDVGVYLWDFLDVEVDGVHILTALREALDKAWEAADDRAKVHISRPRECFAEGKWEEFVAEFSDLS